MASFFNLGILIAVASAGAFELLLPLLGAPALAALFPHFTPYGGLGFLVGGGTLLLLLRGRERTAVPLAWLLVLLGGVAWIGYFGAQKIPVSLYFSSSGGIALTFTGLAALLLAERATAPRMSLEAGVVGGIVLSLGLAALASYLPGVLELGRDLWPGRMGLSNALLFSLTGLAILVESSRRIIADEESAPFWLCLPVTVLALSVTLVLWNLLSISQLRERSRELRAESTGLRSQIIHELEYRMLPLSHMARRWEWKEGTTLRNWLLNAHFLFEHYGDFRLIASIRPDHRVAWRARDGDTPVWPIDTSPGSPLRQLLDREGTRSGVQLTDAIAAGNTPIIWAAVPFYRSNKLNGFLVGAINLNELLRGRFDAWLKRGLSFSIHSGDERLMREGSPAFETADPWAFHESLSYYGLNWTLVVHPTRARLEEQISQLPSLELWLGIALTGFLFLSLYLAISGSVKKKKMEAAQAQSRELRERQRSADKVRFILESAPDAVAVLAPDDSITLINTEGEHLFGYSRADLIGRSAELLFESDGTPLLPRLVGARLLGQSSGFEVRGRRKDGVIFPAEVRLSVFSAGDETLTMAAIRDITSRKRAEDDLLRLTEELKRSNAELEQFAYIISHDLKEPLRMISSFLGLLVRHLQGKLDPRGKEFIEYARDGALRMSQLIDALLAYSRAGRMPRRIAPVDTHKLLEEVTLNLKLAIEESQARLVVEPLPVLNTCPVLLLQLFQNLVGNSLKFRGAAAPRIRIGASHATDGWLFFVEDNGIGIEPEFTERIFQVFQRLHPHGQYAGTGIGLSICRKIVTSLGGRIWVESTPGRGATFFFTVPNAA